MSQFWSRTDSSDLRLVYDTISDMTIRSSENR